MRRIAYYGGSFDPVHRGHLKIADVLSERFNLDEFILVPAFHAPHKVRSKPTSAFHRYGMLALATRNQSRVKVSKIELEAPETPYTVETLTKILESNPDDEIYFVMGADSWEEITTWREWEKVLSIVNIIVVTRPGYEIGFSHVSDGIRTRIVDRRTDESSTGNENARDQTRAGEKRIFITDAVQMDISSTGIRQAVRDGDDQWNDLVSAETAKYIEKYKLYLA